MNWGLILVPVGSGLAGAAVGLVLGRMGQRRPVARQLGYALSGVILLAAVGLMIAARANQGWDGLGYFIMAFFMALPAGLGTAVGTWVGFKLRRR
ncbi:hypothetical protein [Roseicitreum antarcticum]|uniref:Major facilitator superfamily (MFS) profile domain-containing protein n=1 Tax=Roseicitreum antarcticum TaxID=564137 RepID=A0A1H2UEA5_9RHOB|nr:hypothetical protein [Roseicitreum antarcticum]SDW54465.1 hypothetical protein SAMN04488238_102357 [Roseicitreum antarcticum]